MLQMPPAVAIETIQLMVAAHFGIKLRDLKGSSRIPSISRPRMIAMWLARTLTGLSFPKIGGAFNGRDHSTVIFAVNKIGSLLKQDPDLKATVAELEGRLRQLPELDAKSTVGDRKMKKQLKAVFCPSLNRMVKFGRLHPVAIGPHLRMSRYLLGSLPAAPASCDWTPAAIKALTQMYGNNLLGDCVIAGGYHIIGVETGNAGNLFIATEAQIEKDYGAIGGYVPGDPSTDNGCDEITAMNWWTANGFADKVKPLGFITVDPANITEVKQALWLFENCLFGVDLPDAWVNPMPSASGFVWDAAGNPDPYNGHGFNGAGYDSSGVKICTWGMIGKMTWAAVAKYAASSADGQLLVLITPDQLARGQAKAPNGVAWADLIKDFNSLGGHIPIPAPSPAPAPAPPSPSTIVVTKAKAITANGKAVHPGSVATIVVTGASSITIHAKEI